MVTNRDKDQPYALQGVRGSFKAASLHSKSHGSSQMVRDHCKNQQYVLQGCVEAFKSRKLPLKKPREQPNGQKLK